MRQITAMQHINHCRQFILMRISTVILFLIVPSCYSQDNYNARFRQRLEDIRALTYFDNGVVVYDDSSGYGSTFPYWTPELDFYEDDIVTFKGGMSYRALIDNKGKKPGTSPKEWALVDGPHPYLYLRDSAGTQDLVQLLTSDHPYIRVYAFGALVSRNFDKQFQIVVDNLADTSRIDQMTSDYGYTVFPADLMLWYTIRNFDSSKKDVLRKLILTRYSHLITLEEILFFHKPMPEDYQYVRQIAQGDTFKKFGIIALSRYKKQEDIELIREGLKENDYYSGYKVIFMATESFPDAVFKKDLIEYKKEIKMDFDMSGYRYYFYSLAKYKDNECLKVLEEFVNQPVEKDNPYNSANNRVRNLRLILQGLKKYHISLYDALINKIEAQIPKSGPEDFYDYRLEDSPWNY